MLFSKTCLALSLAALLAGCSMTPTYQKPAMNMPAKWSQKAVATGTAVAADAIWWTRFGSAELDQLIARALAGNHDIGAAIQRVEQARAQVKQAGASRRPTLGVSASLSRNLNSGNLGQDNQTNVEGLLTAGYEVDLWGANRASITAAMAGLDQQRFQREALDLTVESEVASDYFQVLALKDRLRIAQSNLEASRNLLQLVQTQYSQGAATALQVAQQQSSLASGEAQIPQLKQQMQALEHALAVLTGQTPEGFKVLAQGLDSVNLPTIDSGQPDRLLERRPDIRAAEAALRGANADVGIARAALLPTLDLSASAGLSGIVSGGTNTVASLVAQLIAPLYRGGELQGQLSQARARLAELVEDYRQTVLVSLQDVEDAQTAIQYGHQRLSYLSTAATSADQAYQLARLQYEAGSVDFLSVLTAEQSRLQSDDSLLQARADQYVNAASLFKALGGGWDTKKSG